MDASTTSSLPSFRQRTGMSYELIDKTYRMLGDSGRRRLVESRTDESVFPKGNGNTEVHLRSDDQAAFAQTDKDSSDIARKAYQYSLIITHRTMREYSGMKKQWLASTYSKADAWIIPELGLKQGSDYGLKAALQVCPEMRAVFTFLSRTLTGQTDDATRAATDENESSVDATRGVHANLTDIVFDNRQDTKAERKFEPVKVLIILDSIADISDVLEDLEVHMLATKNPSGGRSYLRKFPARRMSFYSRLPAAPSFAIAEQPDIGVSFRWFCDVPEEGKEWFHRVAQEDSQSSSVKAKYVNCFEEQCLLPGSDLTIYVPTSPLTGEMVGFFTRLKMNTEESLAQNGVQISVMPPKWLQETDEAEIASRTFNCYS